LKNLKVTDQGMGDSGHDKVLEKWKQRRKLPKKD